jgi:hypothetical protein
LAAYRSASEGGKGMKLIKENDNKNVGNEGGKDHSPPNFAWPSLLV